MLQHANTNGQQTQTPPAGVSEELQRTAASMEAQRVQLVDTFRQLEEERQKSACLESRLLECHDKCEELAAKCEQKGRKFKEFNVAVEANLAKVKKVLDKKDRTIARLKQQVSGTNISSGTLSSSAPSSVIPAIPESN